jgi:bifunctional UDP-N-acetylglucosamine pyrophosphorylase/glucosamine-1-phosphate N-acetyltransferase
VEELHASKIQKKIELCNSGIMICDSKLLFDYINKISNNNIKKERYLPDIFKILHDIKKSFSYILGSEEEMLGVNTIKDLIKIDQIFQKRIKDKIIDEGVIIQLPETVRMSFDTKIKKGSIIEPFVTIKSGVLIKENVLIKSNSVLESCSINRNTSVGPSARIRPHSKIGQNVKIGNYVEIKNSKIGNNCSIGHLSYIGDSDLGKHITIGAGTITCNYDGLNKHVTIVEDGAFIGSNSSLVAPIKIEQNSIIAAGSVITKDVPKNSLSIARSNQKNLLGKAKELMRKLKKIKTSIEEVNR